VIWELEAGNRVALHRIIENGQAPAADILLPIARGFDAFARGKWAKVVEEIGPVLETHERVGGSRAQRDLLEYTVTCALLRNGQRDEALQLISRRRPANPDRLRLHSVSPREAVRRGRSPSYTAIALMRHERHGHKRKRPWDRSWSTTP
jgi:hypothetical protein